MSNSGPVLLCIGLKPFLFYWLPLLGSTESICAVTLVLFMRAVNELDVDLRRVVEGQIVKLKILLIA